MGSGIAEYYDYFVDGVRFCSFRDVAAVFFIHIVKSFAAKRFCSWLSVLFCRNVDCNRFMFCFAESFPPCPRSASDEKKPTIVHF